jgi:DNA-binding transcriptional regulator YhcF (GntR family)
MVSFDDFTQVDGVPIYTQIILYIQRGAIAGTIQDGEELPSRRTLSALLGVNPNTVQKAFRLLEEEGLLVSRSGAKSEMSLTQENLNRIRADLMERDTQTLISAMQQMGVEKGELLRLIDTLWPGKEENP